jgi:hypothetical protein
MSGLMVEVAGSGFRIVDSGHDPDPDHDPGQNPVAKRHEHARADGRQGKRVGHTVRERIERGDRDGDGNEAHRRLLGVRGGWGGWNRPAKEPERQLQVVPGLTLVARAAEEKGWMKRGNELRAAKVEYPAAQL